MNCAKLRRITAVKNTGRPSSSRKQEMFVRFSGYARIHRLPEMWPSGYMIKIDDDKTWRRLYTNSYGRAIIRSNTKTFFLASEEFEIVKWMAVDG